MAGFEERFSRDQGDFFALLADLILAYEEEDDEERFPKGGLSSHERLQHLV